MQFFSLGMLIVFHNPDHFISLFFQVGVLFIFLENCFIITKIMTYQIFGINNTVDRQELLRDLIIGESTNVV